MIRITSKSRDAARQLRSAKCDDGAAIVRGGHTGRGDYSSGWFYRTAAGDTRFLGRYADAALETLRESYHVVD